MKKRFQILLLLSGLLQACKSGEPLANQAPDTRISISHINLWGTQRLNTEVTLHWLGSDVDGFVEGYEISFNQAQWFSTHAEDSTFTFSIDSGSDTTDIDFWVRAIDDGALADPSPAYLSIPIKNSAPTAKFDSTRAVPDTVNVLASLFWSASDPDGFETLDSLFICANGGPWFGLNPSISMATLVPTNPTVPGSGSAYVYKNAAASLDPKLLDGLVVDGLNQLCIKSRDMAGAESPVDTASVFFLRKKGSDLLIVDSHAGGSTPSPREVYLPIISTKYGPYDFIDLTQDKPYLWNPTFLLYLTQYDKVFWYSDEAILSDGQLYLESAAGVIAAYLNEGGKMLISTKFPSSFDNSTSSIFQFAPMDSLSTSTGQARIPADSLVMPEGAFSGLLDTLKSSSFITGADPFYPRPSPNATVVFRAQVQRVSGWSGPNVVAAHTTESSGHINQVFVSVELHKLFGNPAALETFFDQVLNHAFNW